VLHQLHFDSQPANTQKHKHTQNKKTKTKTTTKDGVTMLAHIREAGPPNNRHRRRQVVSMFCATMNKIPKKNENENENKNNRQQTTNNTTIPHSQPLVRAWRWCRWQIG
jgi:hypothetical protein